MKLLRRSVFAVFTTLLACIPSQRLFAQADPGTEPPLASDRKATSPFAKNFLYSTHFNLVMSNFGFAMGGTVERTLSPTSSAVVSLYLAGLRDVSEQTFQDFTGRQFIPNKYNRIFAAPLTMGLKQRLFNEQLSDNFRFHFLATGGVVSAFVYPYFNDSNGNLVWDAADFQTPFSEQIYDPLQGWDKGSWRFGAASEIGVGVDFGDDFESVTSVFFGAMFYYFKDGIQVLEPINKVLVDVIPNPNPSLPPELVYDFVPGASARNFFISPVIRFSFGKSYRRGAAKGK